MNLAPEQREQMRLSILRLCLSPTSTGLLVSYLRAEGFRKLEKPDVEQEIRYLADKTLLVDEAKRISPENKMWRTTADGRDYLAEQGQE